LEESALLRKRLRLSEGEAHAVPEFNTAALEESAPLRKRLRLLEGESHAVPDTSTAA
jgi:hypothetical protein